ncbi:UNKNOWN [Stylonychia lemnae]|uniref:EF-hand domain-containing protein n=1 Tax=Stylonychia lemnae TaxID=5949 RepID=A0A078BAQ0_STYLE|nr:UNKNOWN [Stylonychia lemnae]|eukprot:CDW91434.1 UNKNOWN [Stylonychia lemnae]
MQNYLKDDKIERKNSLLLKYYESNKVKQIISDLHLNREALNVIRKKFKNLFISSDDEDQQSQVLDEEQLKQLHNNKQVWDIEEDQVVQILIDTQATYRTVIKRLGNDVYNYPILRILNEIWNSLIFLIDHFYSCTDRIIDKKYQKLDGVIKLKELVFRRQKNLFVKEFEMKELKYQEDIKKLQLAIERANQSKREVEEQLRQREAEISELTDPQGLKGNQFVFIDNLEMNNLMRNLDEEFSQVMAQQEVKDLKIHHENEKQRKKQPAKISIPKRLGRRNSLKQVDPVNLLDVQYKDRIIVQVQKEFVQQFQNLMKPQDGQPAGASQQNAAIISEQIMNSVFKQIQKKNLEMIQKESPEPIYKTKMKHKSVLKKKRISNKMKAGMMDLLKAKRPSQNQDLDLYYDEEYDVEYDYEDDSHGENKSEHSNAQILKKPPIITLEQEIQTDDSYLQNINNDKDGNDNQPKKQKQNVLLKALKKYGKGKNEKVPMPQNSIYQLMEIAMEEKYKYDIKSDREETFPKFSFDYLIMHYGLKTIALKNLGSISLGLKNLIKDKKNTFASLLIRILGFDDPLKNDEARMMIKSRKFFNEVQTIWVSKLVDKIKDKFKDENNNNIAQGGVCSVFALTDHLIQCLEKNNTVILDEFISKVLPQSIVSREDGQSISIHNDSSFDSSSAQKFRLDYILMRLVHRIQKSGKDLKISIENFFKSSTEDDKSVIVDQLLSNNCQGLAEQDSRFLMWERKKLHEKDKLIQFFHQFDENGDGVLELREFEVLMHHFDSTLQQKEIAHFFNQTLELVQSENPDEMSPDAFCEMMIEHKIGGFGKDIITNQYIDQVLAPKVKQLKDSKKTGQNLI